MIRIYNLILILFLCSCYNSVSNIEDLKNRLVNDDSVINLEIAKELRVALESYVNNNKDDSVLLADCYIDLAYLYTNVFDIPVKGLFYYQRFLEDFPGHSKAPFALFYQAYILENHLNKIDQAELIYKKFLSLYPDHELSETVRFSIQYIGVPVEDLVKRFEEN